MCVCECRDMCAVEDHFVESTLSLSTLVLRAGTLASAVLHAAADSGRAGAHVLHSSLGSASHLWGLSWGFQAGVVSAFTHSAILMVKVT